MSAFAPSGHRGGPLLHGVALCVDRVGPCCNKRPRTQHPRHERPHSPSLDRCGQEAGDGAVADGPLSEAAQRWLTRCWSSVSLGVIMAGLVGRRKRREATGQSTGRKTHWAMRPTNDEGPEFDTVLAFGLPARGQNRVARAKDAPVRVWHSHRSG